MTRLSKTAFLALALAAASARADGTGQVPGITERVASIQCTLAKGRFVADVTANPGGGFTGAITRTMDGKVSVRFKGLVRAAHGDTADGGVVLLFTSPDALDEARQVPSFSLTVDDRGQGELYSSRFKYPRQAVTGSCKITYLGPDVH
jgi:hypothetical protein